MSGNVTGSTGFQSSPVNFFAGSSKAPAKTTETSGHVANLFDGYFGGKRSTETSGTIGFQKTKAGWMC